MPNKVTDTIDSRIPVILFEEGPKIIAYSPEIDLSTCGNTEEQARKSFAEAAGIIFFEIIRMGTVDEVLAECGWQKTADDTWSPPVYKKCIEEQIPIPQGA